MKINQFEHYCECSEQSNQVHYELDIMDHLAVTSD